MHDIAALSMSDYIYLSTAKPGWYNINFSVSRLLGWQQGWAGLGNAVLGNAGLGCAGLSCDVLCCAGLCWAVLG